MMVRKFKYLERVTLLYNMENVKNFCQFINENPNSFCVVETLKKLFKEHNYEELLLEEKWNLEKGKSYFTIKNDLSIVAFTIGKDLKEIPSIKIIASHNDSPAFKIKPNGMISSNLYSKFNTEPYGGAIMSTWFDRPLGISGRVMIKENDETITSKTVKLNTTVVIPNVAVHMDRNIGANPSYNPQIDLLPIVSLSNMTMDEFFEKEGLKNVIAHDLFLFAKDQATICGANNELLCAPRLDDLECVYSSVQAILNANDDLGINICAVFNNEEVGSYNSADSTFLLDIIEEIANTFNINKRAMLAKSLLVSADNAHAVHPNHPEKTDQTNNVLLNKGIVIKYQAGQRYTTEGIGASIFKSVCDQNNIPTQNYTNRSDIRGGGTLGAILTTTVSVNSLDIGLPQLAMHSAFETAGVEDLEYMIQAMKHIYNTPLNKENNQYKIK